MQREPGTACAALPSRDRLSGSVGVCDARTWRQDRGHRDRAVSWNPHPPLVWRPPASAAACTFTPRRQFYRPSVLCTLCTLYTREWPHEENPSAVPALDRDGREPLQRGRCGHRREGARCRQTHRLSCHAEGDCFWRRKRHALLFYFYLLSCSPPPPLSEFSYSILRFIFQFFLFTIFHCFLFHIF